MEHKIGEIVTLPDGRKAKVVNNRKRQDCNGCVFITQFCCLNYEDVFCDEFNRTDHKNIIYKEVKED